MKTINERIKYIISQYYSNNESDFCKAIGLKQPTLNSITGSRKSKPNFDTIVSILNATAITINAEWLITGKGEVSKKKELGSFAFKNSEGLGIPMIPIEAVAGFFSGVDSDGIELSKCDHYVVPEFESIGAEFVIRVSGSSMMPKFSNGDVLACKRISEITFFQWGKVYVLDTRQGALVKRVFEHENKEFLICHSDNKENYPAFELPKSEIRSMSIVLGVIRIE